jgi:hypothetical protein
VSPRCEFLMKFALHSVLAGPTDELDPSIMRGFCSL